MILDLLMIVILLGGFGITKLFADWCAKQIKR